MPQGQGSKRLRVENADISGDVVEVPTYIRSLSERASQKMNSIQVAVCRKEEAIRKLSRHLEMNSCPKSLQWSPKVFVTKEHQSKMNEIVTTAARKAQHHILQGLLEVRRIELDILKEEIVKIEDIWKCEVNNALVEMAEERIISGDTAIICDHFLTDFKETAAAGMQAVRVNCFLDRKSREQQKRDVEVARQERRMEDTLSSFDVTRLTKVVNGLSSRLASLESKNVFATPQQKQHTDGRKNSGRGASQKQSTRVRSPTKRNRSPRYKKLITPSKHNTTTRVRRTVENSGEERESRKHHSRFKPSMTQSDSKLRNSRQKRG